MDSAERALMVQPLIEAIVRDGELSLMFIDGAFSHAVRKRARAGEWRVQAEYGGSAEPVSPEPATVMAARTALAVAPAPSLYARADGFLEGGRFVLTELELLEPSLFMRSDPQAGGDVALDVWDDVVHVWQWYWPMLEAGNAAIARLSTFLLIRLTSSGAAAGPISPAKLGWS